MQAIALDTRKSLCCTTCAPSRPSAILQNASLIVAFTPTFTMGTPLSAVAAPPGQQADRVKGCQCRFGINLFSRIPLSEGIKFVGALVIGVRKLDLVSGGRSSPPVAVYSDWSGSPGFTIVPSFTQAGPHRQHCNSTEHMHAGCQYLACSRSNACLRCGLACCHGAAHHTALP